MLPVKLKAQESSWIEKKSNQHLFNEQELDGYEYAIQKGVKTIIKAMSLVQQPFQGVSPEELSDQIQSIDLNANNLSLDQALQELHELYFKNAVYFHHPRYLAHLNCPIFITAIIGELIATTLNSSLDTWDQSAGATLIEQKIINRSCQQIGFNESSDGVFTSGGTQSNLMAVLLARDNLLLNNKRNYSNTTQGLTPDASKYRIFTSEVSHFSIKKSAAIAGLGHKSVISIPVDKNYCMNSDKLEQAIKKSIENNQIPIMVVATAGTTDFGSIDPIKQIAKICEEYHLWLHVDAAYGCGLLESSINKKLLHGINHASSVTIDFHKSYFQPISCGAFLVKDKQTLNCLTHHADYLNPISQTQEGIPNLVNKSLQTTRRFDALKLWLTLRVIGGKAIGDLFDNLIKRAKETHELITQDSYLKSAHRPQISLIVFRYEPRNYNLAEETINHINTYIKKTMHAQGKALIASTKVKGNVYLKFTILNPNTTLNDIKYVLNLIKKHGDDYLKKRPSPN